VKFVKFYLLKRQNWLQQNYYVHKKNKIIVTSNVKQYEFQILFEHFDIPMMMFHWNWFM